MSAEKPQQQKNPAKCGSCSEDEMGEKVDRCIADTLLKTAGGFAIGVVASVALLKGRTAPVWLGMGIGLGMGLSNCRHDLQKPYALHGKKIRVGDDAAGNPVYQIVVQNKGRLNGN